MFLLYTGARIGETLSINIEDLDKINNCVKVVGKGNKERKLNIKRFVFYCNNPVDIQDNQES